MAVALGCDGDAGRVECGCCGRTLPESGVVRLGARPDVAVCLRCAHRLHQQARDREDALRPSPAGRIRHVLRAGRQLAVRRGWHHTPVVGPVLRWLGPRLP